LPFIWIAWIALRNFRSGTTADELPEYPLYTESGTEGQANSAVSAKD